MTNLIGATPPEPVAAALPSPAPGTVDHRPVRRAALIAGVGIMALAVLAGGANVVVLQGMLTSTDPARTAADIAGSQTLFHLGVAALYLVVVLDVVVAWALLQVFSPVNRELSRLAAWFRLAYAAVFLVALSQLAGVPQALNGTGFTALVPTEQRPAQALVKIETFNDIWSAGARPVRRAPRPDRVPGVPLRLRPEAHRGSARRRRRRLRLRQRHRPLLRRLPVRRIHRHVHRRATARHLAAGPWPAPRRSAQPSDTHREADMSQVREPTPTTSLQPDPAEQRGVRRRRELSLWQLNLLRVGYLFMGGGLALIKWPLLFNHEPWSLAEGTKECLLIAMSFLALLGLRYPQRMLPILLFEVTWKLLWLGVVALPLWSDNRLDGAFRTQTGTVLLVVVIIAVIPWRYVLSHYVMAPGDPWRRKR